MGRIAIGHEPKGPFVNNARRRYGRELATHSRSRQAVHRKVPLRRRLCTGRPGPASHPVRAIAAGNSDGRLAALVAGIRAG